MPLDMRIFIAFPVSEMVRNSAQKLQQEVRKRYPYLQARWVQPSTMHITLEFLGAITSQQLSTVQGMLEYQTKKVAPFLFTLESTTLFHTTYRVATLVVTVIEKDTGYSAMLRKAVHEELSLHNLSRDYKMWCPHLTLARVKDVGNGSIAGIENVPFESLQWSVTTVELLESTLTPHGPQHTKISTFHLG